MYTDDNIAVSLYIDLTTVAKAIDQDVADTLISATSEPANPQFTYAVQASDIPSSQYVQSWCWFITGGGKNNDVATRVVNVNPTYNGVNVLSAAIAISPTTVSSFYRYLVRAGSSAVAPLKAGDVLGVKMWASVANQIDYRYFTIYIVPWTMTQPQNCFITPATQGFVLSGAIAGVSYGTLTSNSGIYDPSNYSSAVPGFNGTGDVEYASMAGPLQSIVFRDNSNVGSGTTATASLQSLITQLLYRRWRFQVD